MMKDEIQLSSAEKGLLRSAAFFSILALVMIIGPYVLNYLVTRGIEDTDRALRTGIAFGMTFGLLMLSLGAFSWLGSIILCIINLFSNKKALFRTKLGKFTLVSNILILCYGAFFITMILKK